MNANRVSRRQFINRALHSAGTVVASSGVASGLSACHGGDLRGRFDHGVASGDPLQDRVILWTRVTPLDEKKDHRKQSSHAPHSESIWVSWQIATDPDFEEVVVFDAAATDAGRDFTLKVDAQGLRPGQTYYYRFMTTSHTSVVGRTRTLPTGAVDRVKLAVVSCSNYPAGMFHVYSDLAQLDELDAVLHLGDYLYEYARDGYASENAAALGRQVEPANEIVSLADYRTRYAQYRSDPDLQAAHAAAPFICVWDDHEIANDTWRAGAENHNDGEGPFSERVRAALQAYAEWLPIRPAVDDNLASLQRSFAFGELVNLSMLDTRLVGRDRQLALSDYFSAEGQFDAEAFVNALGEPERSLLGSAQRQWVHTQLASPATWQVLGQQVLMGTMELPIAIATQQLSIAEYAELAQLAELAAENPASLTPAQQQLLAERGALLSLGRIPYNLDAWDGYPVERAELLNAALENGANLVVLAGDTHNAWASNLVAGGQAAGVEFATPSVSSPGLEAYLGLEGSTAIQQAEAALTQLIDNLQYTNLADRGYLTVTFTPDAVKSQWTYVNTVHRTDYSILDDRGFSANAAVRSNRITTPGSSN